MLFPSLMSHVSCVCVRTIYIWRTYCLCRALQICQLWGFTSVSIPPKKTTAIQLIRYQNTVYRYPINSIRNENHSRVWSACIFLQNNELTESADLLRAWKKWHLFRWSQRWLLGSDVILSAAQCVLQWGHAACSQCLWLLSSCIIDDVSLTAVSPHRSPNKANMLSIHNAIGVCFEPENISKTAHFSFIENAKLLVGEIY